MIIVIGSYCLYRCYHRFHLNSVQFMIMDRHNICLNHFEICQFNALTSIFPISDWIQTKLVFGVSHPYRSLPAPPLRPPSEARGVPVSAGRTRRGAARVSDPAVEISGVTRGGEARDLKGSRTNEALSRTIYTEVKELLPRRAGGKRSPKTTGFDETSNSVFKQETSVPILRPLQR